MPKVKEFDRALNGEAIINDGSKEAAHDQVVLVANAAGYPPNSLIGKITSGADINKWGAFDPAATDGRQNPKGYLYESRGASTGTQRATALTRAPVELNGKKLGGPGWTGASAPQKAAAITSMGTFDATSNIGGVRIRF